MAFQTYDKVVDTGVNGDHTTIQAAVSALGTSGGSIFVRGGLYTESVVIPDSTEDLEIHLAVDAIVKATGSDECIDIGAGCSNITIKGGQLRGVSAAQDGIKVGASSRVKFEDVILGSTTATDKVAKGFVVAGAHVELRNCVIISPTGDGIEAAASISELMVEGCSIYDAGGHGIELLASASRVTLNGNMISNPAGSGIIARASAGVVTGNQIYNPTSSGIDLVSSTYISVVGNQVYSPGAYGVTGDSGTKPTYCTVVGNPVYDATSGVYENLDGTGMAVGSNTAADIPTGLHVRQHAITNGADHTAGDWKIFYSNGSGELVELALGASGEVLKAMGPSAAPQFGAVAGVTLVLTDLTGTAWRVGYIDGDGNMTELALGAAGTVFKSGGASVAPSWGTVELDDQAATGAADGHVLTADGANGAAWEAVTVLGNFNEDTDSDTDSGATHTVDLANGTVHALTLTANCTLTFSNPAASGRASSFTLVLTQDGTGSRTVTWPASVKWPAGTAPTLTTDANGVDILTFFTLDGGTTWYGFVAGQAMA